jgi:opacity protein-like surface antigen
MKKLKIKLMAFTALTALMFSSNIAIQAQTETTKKGEFGLHYMPTFTKIDVRDSQGNVIPGSVSLQNGFGMLLGFNISNHIGIQGEINYLSISQKYKDASLDREVSIRYINVPLLLTYNTNKSAQFNINFVAGPEFGFNTGADINTSGTEGTDSVQAVVVLKKGNVGLAYGAGLEFAMNKNRTCFFELGYRGFYSFVDVTATVDNKENYNAIVEIPKNRNSVYVGLTVQF